MENLNVVCGAVCAILQTPIPQLVLWELVDELGAKCVPPDRLGAQKPGDLSLMQACLEFDREEAARAFAYAVSAKECLSALPVNGPLSRALADGVIGATKKQVLYAHRIQREVLGDFDARTEERLARAARQAASGEMTDDEFAERRKAFLARRADERLQLQRLGARELIDEFGKAYA